MSVPALFVLSPGTLTSRDGTRFADAARALVGMGAAFVLREPGLPDGAYLTLAHELCDLPSLFLHDRPHLVKAAGATGAHVGFRSLSPREAATVGHFPIGLSTHAHDELERWEGAEYLFHGPVRDTPSKRGVVDTIGFPGLAAACQCTTIPVLALGGLQANDVPACLDAGARGVAILSGAWEANWRTAPVADNVERYLRALENAVA